MGNVRVILTINQCANKDICKVIGGHAASQPSCACTLSQCYSNCMIARVFNSFLNIWWPYKQPAGLSAPNCIDCVPTYYGSDPWIAHFIITLQEYRWFEFPYLHNRDRRFFKCYRWRYHYILPIIYDDAIASIFPCYFIIF